jgi:hypothetical protein
MLFGAVLLVLLGGALWIAWGLPKIDFRSAAGGAGAITLEAPTGLRSPRAVAFMPDP